MTFQDLTPFLFSVIVLNYLIELKMPDKELYDMKTDFLHDFLKKVPAFINLPDRAIDDIKGCLYKEVFKKNTIIYHEGDTINKLYILEMGKIEIYKTDLEGKRLTLWFIHPGELFCLPTMLYELAIANAVVVQDSILYCLDKADYERLAGKHPEISEGMLRCLAGRIMNYADSINKVAFGSASSRIAEVIFKHLQRDDHGQMTCQLPQSELSSLAGICRETVSRTIKRFKQEGILDVRGRKMVIKDIERLQSRGFNKT